MTAVAQIVACPGRCGFIVEQSATNLLNIHLRTCAKGAAAAEQLRMFALWMITNPEMLQDGTAEFTAPELARILVQRFIGVI